MSSHHFVFWSVHTQTIHIKLNQCPTTRVPTQNQTLYFQIPCVFPFFPPDRSQIFPVPIYVICDFYIHKTDLADLSSFFLKNGNFPSILLSKYLLPLESGNLQLEQIKFPVFSLCFGKFSKVPVFSLTGIFFDHFLCFPRFPCAVGTLSY